MVKHTQAIRWLLSNNCLSVSDHFVGFALKGLMKNTADVSLNVSQNEAGYVNKHRVVFKVSFIRQLTETRLALSLSSCKNID